MRRRGQPSPPPPAGPVLISGGPGGAAASTPSPDSPRPEDARRRPGKAACPGAAARAAGSAAPRRRRSGRPTRRGAGARPSADEVASIAGRAAVSGRWPAAAGGGWRALQPQRVLAHALEVAPHARTVSACERPAGRPALRASGDRRGCRHRGRSRRGRREDRVALSHGRARLVSRRRRGRPRVAALRLERRVDAAADLDHPRLEAGPRLPARRCRFSVRAAEREHSRHDAGHGAQRHQRDDAPRRAVPTRGAHGHGGGGRRGPRSWRKIAAWSSPSSSDGSIPSSSTSVGAAAGRPRARPPGGRSDRGRASAGRAAARAAGGAGSGLQLREHLRRARPAARSASILSSSAASRCSSSRAIAGCANAADLEIGQRAPAPERERVTQQARRLLGIGAAQLRARVLDELREVIAVQLAGRTRSR